MLYSEPASALSAVGKVKIRYFQMVNDRGSINGRKIKLISLDDGYSPPKAGEPMRRLIERDGAVAIFGSMNRAKRRCWKVPERQEGAAALGFRGKRSVRRSEAESVYSVDRSASMEYAGFPCRAPSPFSSACGAPSTS